MARIIELEKSSFLSDLGAGLAYGHRFPAGTELTVREDRITDYWNAEVKWDGRTYVGHVNSLQLAKAEER